MRRVGLFEPGQMEYTTLPEVAERFASRRESLTRVAPEAHAVGA